MNKDVKRMQWIVAFCVAAIFLVLAGSLMFVMKGEKAELKKEEKPVEVKLTNPHLSEDHFVATYGAQMQTLKEDLAILQKEVQDQKTKINQKTSREVTYNQNLAEENEAVGTRFEAPNQSNKPPALNEGAVLVIKKVAKTEPERKETKKNVFENTAQGRTGETLLITGSFARAKLLNGVEAPTGGQANGNPVPLLMELTEKAVLPNRYRSDIKRCFVTANATGDLSSERVLIRLDRLSCLTQTGKPIDVKVTGYVAGEDGKTGLRARVVTRSGQAIANALLLGTLAGLGEAVSLASQDSTTHAVGTVTESVENPWRAGLGAGMEDALDRLADYYLKLADKIFPVLEIDAGRNVEIVVTQSASLVTQ